MFYLDFRQLLLNMNLSSVTGFFIFFIKLFMGVSSFRRITTTQSITTYRPTYQMRVTEDFKSSIARKFAEYEVVPDIVSTAPDELCSVIYPGGIVVSPGDRLKRQQILSEPEVHWNAKDTELYTLVMNNIDDREWHGHDSWVTFNIKGCDVFSGDEVHEYKEQRPDEERKIYRIVFLVFKQKKSLIATRNHPGNEFIDVQRLIAQNDLIGPIAGNFFLVEDLVTKPSRWPEFNFTLPAWMYTN